MILKSEQSLVIELLDAIDDNNIRRIDFRGMNRVLVYPNDICKIEQIYNYIIGRYKDNVVARFADCISISFVNKNSKRLVEDAWKNHLHYI
jgi:hypothetical protein